MDDLERLLAERACERLIVEYCRLVDFGEAARIADLFTEDGVWSGVDLVLDGREEIRAWFVKRQGLERRVSRHICTNVGVDVVSPDEARSVCYLVNYRHDRRDGDDAMPVPTEVPKFVGECRDAFRRTDHGWRFTRRHVDVAFVRRRS
jgi:ketosteroid isomerase-like protein